MTDLCMIIGRCSPNNQYGGHYGILRMLSDLISGWETTIEATTKLWDINGKNGQEKTTKTYFSVVLRAIQHSEI